MIPYEMGYIFLLLLAALVALTVSVYSWKKRQAPGATPLAALMAAGCIWCLAYILELLNTDLTTKILWAKVEYFGIAFIPFCWFWLGLDYTQKKGGMISSALLFLMVIPITTVFVVWTNDFHHIYWADYNPASGHITGIHPGRGPWFWVFATYSYSLLLLGALLVLHKLVKDKNLFRWQSVFLILALVATWIANALNLMSITILPNVDNTPLSFAISGVALYYGMVRYHLFELTTVAQEAVLKNIVEIVIVIDKKGRVIDINPAAHLNLGIDASKALGKPLGELITPLKDLTSNLPSKKVSHPVVLVKGPKGDRYFDVVTTPLIEGEVQRGTLLILHDVTEQKDAEDDLKAALNATEDQVKERTKDLSEAMAKLQENEAEFETIFSTVLDSIIISTIREGRIIECNDRLFRYTREEMQGKTTLGLNMWVVTSDRGRFVEEFRAKGYIKDFEAQLSRKDGTTFVGSISSYPIVMRKGTHILSVTRDITDRINSEEKTRRLATIVESSEDAILGKDLKGIITSWNKGAEKTYGYTAEEIIGKPITILAPPDRIDEMGSLIERINRGEIIQHFETQRLTKEGKVITVFLTISPIKDKSGAVIGASTIARDITELKKAEEALRQRSRNEILGILTSALPVFTSTIPPAAWNILIGSFGNRFETNIRPRFEEFLKGYTPVKDNINSDLRQMAVMPYLAWISNLFSEIGIANDVSMQGTTAFINLFSCPWLDENRNNPIFCRICRAMITRSYNWTGLEGRVDQISCLKDRADRCEFHILSIKMPAS